MQRNQSEYHYLQELFLKDLSQKTEEEQQQLILQIKNMSELEQQKYLETLISKNKPESKDPNIFEYSPLVQSEPKRQVEAIPLREISHLQNQSNTILNIRHFDIAQTSGDLIQRKYKKVRSVDKVIRYTQNKPLEKKSRNLISPNICSFLQKKQ